MDKLTVAIVNYNAGDYLTKCLPSLKKASNEADMKIIVIDNASTDDSIKNAQKKFPEVLYILNSENVGFGKANNQVLKNLKTEFVLILNPDVEVEKGVIKGCIEYMKEHQDVGALTPEILLPDGRIDLTAHRGFPTPWASFKYFFLKNDDLYHLSKRDLKNVHEVDAVAGAFLLTRKSVLEKSGYFDEEYFMYAEDIDLCFRIKEKGYRIMYLPYLKVLHFKGVSTGLKKHSQEITTANFETRRRSLDAFYSTMKTFYRKHYAENNLFLINWIIYTGINAKWLLAKRKLTV